MCWQRLGVPGCVARYKERASDIEQYAVGTGNSNTWSSTTIRTVWIVWYFIHKTKCLSIRMRNVSATVGQFFLLLDEFTVPFSFHTSGRKHCQVEKRSPLYSVFTTRMVRMVLNLWADWKGDLLYFGESSRTIHSSSKWRARVNNVQCTDLTAIPQRALIRISVTCGPKLHTIELRHQHWATWGRIANCSGPSMQCTFPGPTWMNV